MRFAGQWRVLRDPPTEVGGPKRGAAGFRVALPVPAPRGTVLERRAAVYQRAARLGVQRRQP